VTEHALPPGDNHEIVQRGDDLAVVVPMEEYQKLRVTYAWHNSPGRVATTPETFLAVSGLSESEQQVLRERYGLGNGPA
jgi:hypothetical protein